MAAARTIRVDDSTRIHLITLLISAQASIEALALALEVTCGAVDAPAELGTLSNDASKIVDAISDLNERLRTLLEREEAGE
jgi:hypothetical protein